jgi:hypothetical protein
VDMVALQMHRVVLEGLEEEEALRLQVKEMV